MKQLVVILLLVHWYCVNGQNTVAPGSSDTLKKEGPAPVISYFHEKDYASYLTPATGVDTSYENIQKYFPNTFQYSLGISGRPTIYSGGTKIGFQSGINHVDVLGFNRDQLKYYRSRAPYTEIFAVFGMKKEQHARIFHTQNITRNWNIALNMLRIRSEGFYQRQNCTDNNLSLSTNFHSKKNRYSLLAYTIITSLRSDENGGLKYDSLFELNLQVNKMLLPVNLKNASTKKRRREIFFKHSLNFGRKENVTKGDSILYRRVRPGNSLSYSFRASDEAFSYTETQVDSGFYENNLYDNSRTNDSLHTEEFRHGLGLQLTFFKKIRFNADAEQSARRLVQHYRDTVRNLDTSFSEQCMRFGFRDNNLKPGQEGLTWELSKKYILKGPFEFNDLVQAYMGYKFKKDKKILAAFNSNTRSVPFIFNHYASNHFWWKNEFEKILETTISIKYKDAKNKFAVGADYNSVFRHVYFDSTFLPRQNDSTIDIVRVFAQKAIRLKHFGFLGHVSWQQSSSDLVRLPKYIVRGSVYYAGRWFKKAVDVRISIDVTYHASYYANAYMPALSQFYLQNERMTGGYPFIDFFFGMNFKRVNVFVKSEHINSGFSGAGYFLAPHIPAPDRSLKVGVKWVFFD